MIFSDARSKLDAIKRSLAIIEFKPDGTIINANKNFLDVVGYSLEEILHKNHRIFLPRDPAQAHGDGDAAYSRFWDELRAGKAHVAEFRRIGKNGREVWIQACYSPVLGRNGKVVSVIKAAIDITGQKQHDAELQSQIDALHRVQALVEFSLDGTVLKANDNFLATLGYTAQ